MKNLKLKAYWKDRIPQLGICNVKSIDFEENRACISNFYVRVYPSLDDIVLLDYTGHKDEKGEEIYEGYICFDGTFSGTIEWNDDECAFMFVIDEKNKYFLKDVKVTITGNIFEKDLK